MKVYGLLDGNGTCFSVGSNPFVPLEGQTQVELEVDNIEDILAHLEEYRVEGNTLVKDATKTFKVAQDQKLEELGKACNETILGHFKAMVDGVEYSFSNDMEAQMNFEKADRAFDKGRVAEIPWTAYDSTGQVVRIIMTPANFEPVYLAHLYHIQGNISKLRDNLQGLVINANSIDEVNLVTWNM